MLGTLAGLLIALWVGVSVNTYLRCLKAFMAWAHEEQIVKEPFKLTWLKEEQKILATLSSEAIKNLINARPTKGQIFFVRGLLRLLFLTRGFGPVKFWDLRNKISTWTN